MIAGHDQNHKEDTCTALDSIINGRYINTLRDCTRDSDCTTITCTVLIDVRSYPTIITMMYKFDFCKTPFQLDITISSNRQNKPLIKKSYTQNDSFVVNVFGKLIVSVVQQTDGNGLNFAVSNLFFFTGVISV